DSPFELEAFSDSDYGGASLDRKSTIGGCQFLGRRLISWQCKKQTIVANSTTEAEYVTAANCCGQVLWIQNHMMDYVFNFMNTKINIDNESTICIVKNPVYHSRTKHIEIRHNFIRDCYEKRLINVIKIHTDANGRQISRLRATNGAELVSAASLVNTARPTLSTTRLGKFGALRQIWCCQANLMLPGKFDAVRQIWCCQANLMLSGKFVSMANLEFVDQHNMVACLEKIEGNSDFHEIVDFLASSSIHHALTESPLKKVKRSDLDAAQIAKDAEIARLVHENELAEMEREREERQRQDQASMDYIASLYDEVQANMDASEELAARLQMEERETYTIEERSKLLAEFFERRKKLLAEERATAVRNKPPTRTQLRSLMMTYLKHTGKYRHN
ncbi:hypothetical protein Tco_1461155, partial [Tanacetum coccineum]